MKFRSEERKRPDEGWGMMNFMYDICGPNHGMGKLCVSSPDVQ